VYDQLGNVHEDLYATTTYHSSAPDMTAENTEESKHSERSAESQEWVKLGRELRRVNGELYAALGGNDEENEVDHNKHGYGESTSSK